MAINITKVSNVILIATDSNLPKAYFNRTGSYMPNAAGDGFDIVVNGDPYSVKRADMRIGGQTPSSMTEANTLLNAIFSV